MKKLHVYQRKVYDLVLKVLTTTGKALMVMAPGLGKTVVSAFLTKAIHQNKMKVLFLCHDNYILGQAHAEFRETFDPLEILKFYDFFGAIKNIHSAIQSDVVFGSFQSLNSKSKWYKKFSKDHFDIIIVDEGHHAQAKTFREVIKYFDPEFSLCMTGTPDRGDNLDIRDLYGDEVVNIAIEEGIAKGWLSKVEYHILADGLNKDALETLFKEVVTEKRRISVNQINKQLFVKKRDQDQIKIIKKYTKDWKKKCIIYCESIHHVRSFAKNLDKGSYVTFHSKNSCKTNNKNLKSFKSGDVNIILSVNKFNEGIDVPDVEVIVFIRATESAIIYRQQLGRGLRLRKGKKKVVVLDFVANIERILMVQGMIQAVQYYAGPVKGDKSLLAVSGANYVFNFSDELEDLLEILQVARMGFYGTWQEAAKAVRTLSIKSKLDYRKRYKEDRQLPASPSDIYADFPGDRVFFGGIKLLSFRELQKEVRKAKIKTAAQYMEVQKNFPSWPWRADKSYKSEWPGWGKFLSDKYVQFLSFEMLKKQVRKAGIQSAYDYKNKYKKHPGWPSGPHQKYKTKWRGWGKFLNEHFVDFLPLNRLKKQVRKAKIRSFDDYKAKYRNYFGWHSCPNQFYKDEWISWTDFFGRTEYLPFKTFVGEVRKAKIKTMDVYKKIYKKHPGWHSAPYIYYKKEWTNWPDVLGTTKFYLPFRQFQKEVRQAGIIDGKWDYKKKYKKHKGWPSTPREIYGKEWPGWQKLLNK